MEKLLIRKAMNIRTADDLQAIIDSGATEGTSLEFKVAPAIDNKDEIEMPLS